MRNIFKKTLIIMFIIIISLFYSSNIVHAGTSDLNLDKLEFKVNINNDGSMDIIEVWNIDIRNTNTLYKTFKIDKNKYSSISNVKVVDITNGRNYEFSQINEEMYHVTPNSFYALTNSKGDFEIAWGIGMDNSSGNRKYEISYTVNDAIGKYEDYAELYWQFIGNDFEINADNITGTIILPSRVSNIQEIKVWGHTEELNGEIYATGKDEIKFQVDNYKAGNMVEIRSLFPSEIIKSSGRTYNQERYDEVLKEETKWANKANMKRMWLEIKDDVIGTFFVFVILALCIIYIEKAVKYGKKLYKLNKFIPSQKLEYFRELPNQNSTPGEALYLLEEPYSRFMNSFGNVFSANILNLKLKGYIDLRIEKINEKTDKIFVKYIKSEETDENNLKDEEKEIYKFIKDAAKEQEEIEIKDLEKYIGKNYSKVQNLIQKTQDNIENELTKEKLFNKEEKEVYKEFKDKSSIYYTMVFISLIMFIIPLSIVFVINGILCSKIAKKTNVLTQEGMELKEKWKGLKKYMEDFSLLNEKEVPAIEVWEKYLVFATAFGIAEKVLKQLKTIYPNIDELDAVNTSTYMYFMYHSNFSSSFSGAISSSISSVYSSSSGGGGGFSGGGGGGRRPEEAVVVDNHQNL